MLGENNRCGSVPVDLGHAVRTIYFSGQEAIKPDRMYLQLAIDTIQQCYLPANTADVFALLAALNLLNAIIKLPWGRHVLTYSYIKTLAALLFDYLSSFPMPDVSIYHNEGEHVTFFRVQGVQFSFHYACFIAPPRFSGMPQTWDGLRLQLIGVEVLLLGRAHLQPRQQTCMAPPVKLRPQRQEPPPPPAPKNYKDKRKIRYKARKAQWLKLRALSKSMQFNFWRKQKFTLYRRQGQRPLRVMRYTGSNAEEVNDFLIAHHPLIYPRPENQMYAGMQYTLNPQMRIVIVKQEDYVRLLCRYNHLKGNQANFNLQLTYNIALYLTKRFPKLRFACTLITNRLAIRNRFFTHAALLRIPPGSRMRQLKVWMPYDIRGELMDFDPTELPRRLVDEYMASEEYYKDYEITFHHGRRGLYAYRRHHLLPPIYRYIRILNLHAYVQRTDGLWAIYSLAHETFVTHFIYSRIWYDRSRCIIFGNIGVITTVIYQFF